MGMSGVQVLSTGSGGCNRGLSQLYALHQARQEGTTTGCPFPPPSDPRQITYGHSQLGERPVGSNRRGEFSGSRNDALAEAKRCSPTGKHRRWS